MTTGPRAGVDGHIFLAIHVDFFCDLESFRRRVDAAIRQIRASRRAEGVERLYSPGELEHETERRYRVEGIPLNQETLRGLRQAAASLAVEVDLSSG